MASDEFRYAELRRRAMRPTARTYAFHIGLLLIVFLTATIAGSIEPFGSIPMLADLDEQSASSVFSFILAFPVSYANTVSSAVDLLFHSSEDLVYALQFSLSLIFILLSHELGHYIACRIYGVDATLPYFIPAPPLLGPAGTLGAFIKIISPLPSRRATFDIGVAGPIAGFVALIPIALLAAGTMQMLTPEQYANSQPELIFSDPLLMKLFASFFGLELERAIPNAFYFATWVGLLVTALNLFPSGQLDGGHAVYAVLGERIHGWTGRTAFVVMATLSVVGWFFYSSPSGFLFTVILGVMMLIRHPRPLDNQPIGFKRRLIAVLTLLIFVLSFVPFPIQIPELRQPAATILSTPLRSAELRPDL